MSGLFSSSKPKQTMASTPPPVTSDPVQTDNSPEALRKAGRASLLLSTSTQGILGQPKTGRQQLLSA